MKIQARWDWSGAFCCRWNIAADILLTYLCQPNLNFSILSLYGTSRSNHANPYRYVDQNYNFDYRFKSRYFTIPNTQLKLSYLVSRLDGLTKDKVLDLISNSANPDYSATSTWVLDTREFFYYNTPYYQGYNYYHNTVLKPANNRLVQLGFNTNFDDLDTSFILTNNGSVMAYSSWGVHSYLPVGYIIDTLDFSYANGAIFNTLESFNGHSMRIIFSDRTIRRNGHRLICEFIYTGGIGGGGHTWEPYLDGAIKINYTYPAYAMGYTLVDACYQGITNLGWQNIIVGDPLTAIAWGKQELTQYLTTWSDRNLVTGEITIPMYKTLTIENNFYIELRHQGFIPCNPSLGRINIGQSVTFQTDDWQRALFLSYASENARIVWADHPTFPAILYNIYRKINDGEWEYIASTMDNEYTDEEVFLTCYECPINAVVHYFVKGVDVYERESEASNEVSAEVIARIPKEQADISSEVIYEYSLSQNYPNPFNPTTKIDYSIKFAGEVTIKVYDVLGNEIATLVNERKEPGIYSVVFNAGTIPSGIYFYKLTSGSFTETKKLLLLK